MGIFKNNNNNIFHENLKEVHENSGNYYYYRNSVHTFRLKINLTRFEIALSFCLCLCFTYRPDFPLSHTQPQTKRFVSHPSTCAFANQISRISTSLISAPLFNHLTQYTSYSSRAVVNLIIV